ncbi:MAG: hypothetical protein P1V20_04350 [Verrucomicrobiales bacterium]|nr:hypothetical protein [Verrucomicrobiales bacterium]
MKRKTTKRDKPKTEYIAETDTECADAFEHLYRSYTAGNTTGKTLYVTGDGFTLPDRIPKHVRRRAWHKYRGNHDLMQSFALGYWWRAMEATERFEMARLSANLEIWRALFAGGIFYLQTGSTHLQIKPR